MNVLYNYTVKKPLAPTPFLRVDKSNDLEVAHPPSGTSSTWFLVELEFGNVGFRREETTGVPGEKPLGVKEPNEEKLNPLRHDAGI